MIPTGFAWDLSWFRLKFAKDVFVIGHNIQQPQIELSGVGLFVPILCLGLT